jgi:hypothetical protein
VVDFEDKLVSALQNLETPLTETHSEHLSGDSPDLEHLQPEVRQEAIDPDGNGINGVDMDREMAEMAETQLRYLTGVELLKRRYEGLKSIIRGTGQYGIDFKRKSQAKAPYFGLKPIKKMLINITAPASHLVPKNTMRPRSGI